MLGGIPLLSDLLGWHHATSQQKCRSMGRSCMAKKNIHQLLLLTTEADAHCTKNTGAFVFDACMFKFKNTPTSNVSKIPLTAWWVPAFFVVLLEWFDDHLPSSKCPSALQSSNIRVAWRHANPLPDNALMQRLVLYVTHVVLVCSQWINVLDLFNDLV